MYVYIYIHMYVHILLENDRHGTRQVDFFGRHTSNDLVTSLASDIHTHADT